MVDQFLKLVMIWVKSSCLSRLMPNPCIVSVGFRYGQARVAGLFTPSSDLKPINFILLLSGDGGDYRKFQNWMQTLEVGPD